MTVNRELAKDFAAAHTSGEMLVLPTVWDVWSARLCVDAGFNSYLTKPVDFKELSTVLMAFMDPADPAKPHPFMNKKRM